MRTQPMKHKARRRMSARDQERRKMTFTKRLITIITATALIDVQLSYILAFFGHETLSVLSERIVEVLLGVIFGYLIKSYFETKQEKKQELDEYKAQMRYEGADGRQETEQEEYGHG